MPGLTQKMGVCMCVCMPSLSTPTNFFLILSEFGKAVGVQCVCGEKGSVWVQTVWRKVKRGMRLLYIT